MEQWKEENDGNVETATQDQPQLVVQQFSMEALHHIMLKNDHQILGMYDEMSVMYGQLDAYKHSGSRLDRSTLLDLYSGGSWCRSFKNKEQSMSKMRKTAFNMCGFIQPSFVVEMLQSSDPDGFNDRQLFVCPEETEYKYEQLKVPMDPTVPDLKAIFGAIQSAHKESVMYTFNTQGREAFIAAHDELCDRKLSIPDNEDRRGIISKFKGILARIAMVLHALENGINKVTNHDGTDSDWDATVTKEHVQWATEIMRYLIDQKFALMPAELKVSTPEDKACDKMGLDNYLSKFLTFKGDQVQASDVSQYRLMPPTPLNPTSKNKYPVENVKAYMGKVADAGFGRVVESVKKGSKRKSTTFYKYTYDELEDEQTNTLKKLKIDRSTYEDSFLDLSSSSLSSSTSYVHAQPLITLTTPTSGESTPASTLDDSNLDTS